MSPKQLFILLASIVFLILGLGISFVFPGAFTPFSYNVHPWINPVIDLFFFTLGAFILSTLAFGYFAPLIFLYTGLLNGGMLLDKPVIVILKLIPISIAIYLGSVVGDYLWQDLNGKSNFFSTKRLIIIVSALLVAGIAALVVGLLIPFIPGIKSMFARLIAVLLGI